MKFSIIVSATASGGIGYRGVLPCPAEGHLHLIEELTTVQPGTVIITGSRAYHELAIPPSPNRTHVVLSRRSSSLPDAVVCSSLSLALELFQNASDVFVLGGEWLFREAIHDHRCHQVYLRRVSFPGRHDEDDVTIRGFTAVQMLNKFSAVIRSTEPHCCVLHYRRDCEVVNSEENQYIKLVTQVLREGEHRRDRTGTGTLSIFGASLRFSLKSGRFPLLTTKRVPMKAIFEELLWFIRGETDGQVLADRGVGIWKKNGTREALDEIGLPDRPEHDLGPIYGHQWRHFGAAYVDCHADYTGQGVDQLAELVNNLRTDPNSRRHLLVAFNPAQRREMALPPCHAMCQFYVSGPPDKQELSCQMYQRSADIGLGLPFNIASYALLTRLLASVCGMTAKELIVIIGDAHIYVNHVDALRLQVERRPRPFPTLSLVNPPTTLAELEQLEWSNVQLTDYHPYEKIVMDMSV
jgi:dihydrofolate reductase/thymidylate synthase